MVSKVRPKRIFASFVVASSVALYAPAPFAEEQSAEVSAAQAASASRPSLDYEFFKTRVEPIFLKNRSADHVRCYACHQVSRHGGGPLSLALLPPGRSFGPRSSLAATSRPSRNWWFPAPRSRVCSC